MSSLEDMSFEQRDQMAMLMRDLSDHPTTRKDILRFDQKNQARFGHS